MPRLFLDVDVCVSRSFLRRLSSFLVAQALLVSNPNANP